MPDGYDDIELPRVTRRITFVRVASESPDADDDSSLTAPRRIGRLTPFAGILLGPPSLGHSWDPKLAYLVHRPLIVTERDHTERARAIHHHHHSTHTREHYSTQTVVERSVEPAPVSQQGPDSTPSRTHQTTRPASSDTDRPPRRTRLVTPWTLLSVRHTLRSAAQTTPTVINRPSRLSPLVSRVVSGRLGTDPTADSRTRDAPVERRSLQPEKKTETGLEPPVLSSPRVYRREAGENEVGRHTPRGAPPERGPPRQPQGDETEAESEPRPSRHRPPDSTDRRADRTQFAAARSTQRLLPRVLRLVQPTGERVRPASPPLSLAAYPNSRVDRAQRTGEASGSESRLTTRLETQVAARQRSTGHSLGRPVRVRRAPTVLAQWNATDGAEQPRRDSAGQSARRTHAPLPFDVVASPSRDASTRSRDTPSPHTRDGNERSDPRASPEASETRRVRDVLRERPTHQSRAPTRRTVSTVTQRTVERIESRHTPVVRQDPRLVVTRESAASRGHEDVRRQPNARENGLRRQSGRAGATGQAETTATERVVEATLQAPSSQTVERVPPLVHRRERTAAGEGATHEQQASSSNRSASGTSEHGIAGSRNGSAVERKSSPGQHISPLESIANRHMDADPTLDRLVDYLFTRFERKRQIERERRGR